MPAAIASEVAWEAWRGWSGPACVPQLRRPSERPAGCGPVRRGWCLRVRSCGGCRADPRWLSDLWPLDCGLRRLCRIANAL